MSGGSGRGSVVHLATEKFKQLTGMDIEMIPYAGQPPAIADLISGRVQFMRSVRCLRRR